MGQVKELWIFSNSEDVPVNVLVEWNVLWNIAVRHSEDYIIVTESHFRVSDGIKYYVLKFRSYLHFIC